MVQVIAQFRSTVLLRDNRKCCLCGATKHLEIHHIKPRRIYPELRYEPSNGQTLCRHCHKHIPKQRKPRLLSHSDYLTVDEVAIQLEVDQETVRRWLRDRKLTGVKAGDSWRIAESELQEFIMVKPEKT